jgi:hypothetical protein
MGDLRAPYRRVAAGAFSLEGLLMKVPVSISTLVLLFIPLAALLGCASGAPSNTSSVTAPGTDIAAYETFGWQAASNPSEAPLTILDGNIQEAIRARLLEKGYREVANDPDLRISFETTTVVAEKASKPSPVRIGVGVGSWGGPVGVGAGTSVPVGRPGGAVTEQETRLTIRAVDPTTNREVWIGSSTGEITEDMESGAIEKVVTGTLAEFPKKRK